MTRALRLVGLPVISEGSRLGVVDAVSLARSGKKLAGLHTQGRGFRAGFVDAANVRVLGESAVLVEGKPSKRAPRFHLRRVRDTSGLRLGMVTDVMLDETDLHVEAVELSFGPIDDLLRGRCWVRDYSVDPDTGDVIVSSKAWQDPRLWEPGTGTEGGCPT